MKYKLEHFVRTDGWNGLRTVDVARECEILGEAFVNLVQALEKVDPDNVVLKLSDISYRVKLLRATAEKERKAQEKKRADAKARKDALSKLSREEQIAFGLIKD